ncbi:hypothetical protein QJQ45_008050 [Haematococcus lacustris]|nr:hypothetical protein QJQ45_008050 [Haematococcus lacustris]
MSELRARRGHSDGVWKANRPAGTTNRFQSGWLEGREMWLADFGLQGNLYRVRCTACDLVLNSHLHTIQKHEDSARHKQNLAAKQPGMGISQLWQSLSKQPITALEISEYGRLAELAMVMVPGSVEEERMFSAMAYLKDDTRNRLNEEHLNVCARAFHTVTHGVSDFPYHEAIGVWLDAANKKGRYGV